MTLVVALLALCACDSGNPAREGGVIEASLVPSETQLELLLEVRDQASGKPTLHAEIVNDGPEEATLVLPGDGSAWGDRMPAYEWIVEHLDGMLGAGIAFHTAFLVFGASRFMDPLFAGSPLQLIPWILPTLIGVPAGAIWKRRVLKATPTPA